VQEGANIMSRQLCMANVADFCRETQLISSLQHPNVVRVFGVVQGQRSPAIVTECLERSLRHTLDRQVSNSNNNNNNNNINF
jgi:serine/threonine protein kinase